MSHFHVVWIMMKRHVTVEMPISSKRLLANGALVLRFLVAYLVVVKMLLGETNLSTLIANHPLPFPVHFGQVSLESEEYPKVESAIGTVEVLRFPGRELACPRPSLLFPFHSFVIVTENLVLMEERLVVEYLGTVGLRAMDREDVGGVAGHVVTGQAVNGPEPEVALGTREPPLAIRLVLKRLSVAKTVDFQLGRVQEAPVAKVANVMRENGRMLG